MHAHTSQHTELRDQNFVALKLHEMPTFIQPSSEESKAVFWQLQLDRLLHV